MLAPYVLLALASLGQLSPPTATIPTEHYERVTVLEIKHVRPQLGGFGGVASTWYTYVVTMEGRDFWGKTKRSFELDVKPRVWIDVKGNKVIYSKSRGQWGHRVRISTRNVRHRQGVQHHSPAW